MIYDVRHSNTIQYSGPVHLAQFNVRLKPAPWPGQTVTGYQRLVDPLPSTLQEECGAYVVNEARLTLRDPITQLRVDSSFTVELLAPAIDLATAPSPTVAELRALALTKPDLTSTSPAASKGLVLTVMAASKELLLTVMMLRSSDRMLLIKGERRQRRCVSWREP